MSPYRRQTLTIWIVAVVSLACGLTLWWVGLETNPVATVLATYLGGFATVAGYRWMRRCSSWWPDVAGAQMRELERRREGGE